MRNILNVTVCFLLLFLVQNIQAQKSFDKELIFGGGLHSRGFLLTSEYSKIQSETRSFSFRIEFTEFKNAKEKRLTAERLATGGNSRRSYIYGKQNNFYALRLGGGHRFYISEKTEKSPVALAFSYNGGFSMGMLKPYYLDLIYRLDPTGFRLSSERYTEQNKLVFLEPLDINGATGFSAGWDELTVAPGLFAKGSLIFDWGANDGIAKILELGFTADIYFRNIPIMVDEVRPPLFVNLFMNFYFGKRW